ncbi:MAG: 2Fe-2S iron-sulfur cluster binding domain-containing protein [Bacteroidia bacterium]|nr:2Fe-2S iron-sulfur cluster binding domain-containing protein [Bacteroidia bacterium]
MSEKFKITFRFEDGKTPETIIEARRGDSILDTALDNNINLHHNCGGVCACSTCHVYIDNGMELLPEISDSEENFIDRAVNPKLNSRLACQCEINGNVTVTIPDQSVHLGH